MLDQLNKWDRELFIYLNSLGIEEYDSFWIFATNIKHWIPLYILFFILFFIAFHKKKALFNSAFLLASFLTTLAFTNFVKGIAVRLRPNNDPELLDIIRILQTPTNYSFFSGHASSSFVVTTFVVLSLREKYKWIYVVYIWPIIFVLSRVYVGVHYPLDLLVGGIVGLIFGYIFYELYLLAGKRFY
ncbi:phosphatase PAP2 family protein [Gillisia hiemivivida]|uniref:Phosphatase PAP2 family protein n=1 Tax=Gillisia hiemivivida TaxID=291190 RepID=A0A5C6ZU29_9FLAO|nr:phosphatase PAP2 family protein [Gillisia hiemivivida]TXD93365.1 phosphatase PAP2 family protein [Gillisia hiemivivida]